MKIIVAGDYCDRFRVSDIINEGNYDSMFGEVKPIIESADVSVVNFEFPIVLTESMPIPKCGPNLRGQKESVDAIKYAGFNVCTLANNHILDQGEECCLDTKRLLEEAGMKTVGAGKNLAEASEILYFKQGMESLAIINCCEHEFSIATETTAGANPLNPIQQFYKIQEAKSNADYVLVIVHGGHEHYQLPSPRMKETFRFFVDAGADAVVNHHQHCYSGYEVYEGKPIFYGLGNFCFDWDVKRNTLWNEGFMLILNTESIEKDLFELIPYTQCNESCNVSISVDKKTFNDRLLKINSIISDDKQLTDCYKCWTDANKDVIDFLFQPYSGELFQKLYIHKLLPSFLSKQKALLLLNFLECESHHERVLSFLREIIFS